MELDWRRLIEVECAPWLMRAYASKGCDPTELVRKMIDREKKRSIETDSTESDDSQLTDPLTNESVSLATVSAQQLCDIKRATRL